MGYDFKIAQSYNSEIRNLLKAEGGRRNKKSKVESRKSK